MFSILVNLYNKLIENNNWTRLGELEDYINSGYNGYGLVVIPRKDLHLNDQIILFGGWNGKTYTNQTILIDESIVGPYPRP